MNHTRHYVVKHYPPVDGLPRWFHEGWQFRECAPGFGAVNRVEKIAYIPMDRSVFSYNIRLHELAHMIWSLGLPAQWMSRYRIRIPESYQAAEDARIQRLLGLSGLDLGSGFHPPEQLRSRVETLAHRRDLLGSCLMLLASAFSGSHPVVRQALQDLLALDADPSPLAEVFALADEAVAAIARDPTDPRTAARTARNLEKRFRQQGWVGRKRTTRSSGSVLLIVPPTPGGSGKDWPVTGLPDRPAADLLTELGELLRLLGGKRDSDLDGWEVLGELLRARSSRKLPGATPGAGGLGPEAADPGTEPPLVPWGRLRVEEPARVRSLPGRLGWRWHPSRDGFRLHAPHRLLLDDFVFARKGRARGGTVLIDGSGSMHLSIDDVWSIVQAAPGATVAIYAGNGDAGTLRILARHGRVVAREDCRHDHMGRMNVVDGPALCWLAAQPAPRIWISDGLVSGVGDRSQPGNVCEARRLVQAGRIERIPAVKSAVEHLRRVAGRPAASV